MEIVYFILDNQLVFLLVFLIFAVFTGIVWSCFNELAEKKYFFMPCDGERLNKVCDFSWKYTKLYLASVILVFAFPLVLIISSGITNDGPCHFLSKEHCIDFYTYKNLKIAQVKQQEQEQANYENYEKQKALQKKEEIVSEVKKRLEEKGFDVKDVARSIK